MDMLVEILDENGEFVHEFRNFGEEVYESLGAICDISLEEIDASIKSFTIRSIPEGLFKEVQGKLKDIARDYFSEDMLVVKEVLRN